ncbi:MAG: pyrroline-5-carboxylate reductase [Candidatus Latescibacterota bacterium]|nr:pyrroline-5-carboxylate reductase [Candidatus Latescibacterota bacterium]MEE2725512.1 pyrroline-5-carboxylate reductase [Candidatus Latescibacterota bacterium]
MNNHRIGFIGAGNMSQALIAGLLYSGSVPIQSLSASDPVPATLRALSERGMLTGVELPIAVRERDFIFLGIKPQVADAVLPQLADALVPGQVVVSMMAGVQTASIERYMGGDTPVIRVMPQTLVRLRMGACALCGGRFATAEHIDQVRQILELVGSAVEVSEAQMDAVTGLSGSGPAYVYAMVDALADGGVRAGLPRDIALQLAAQTVAGAAQMVLQSEHHPAELKEQVTSPGGTTIAGLHALERGGLRAALMNAVVEASERSRELGSS